MPSYRVTWEIDIDADTPEEAAKAARAIQIKPDSTATVFKVEAESSHGEVEVVDLQPLFDEEIWDAAWKFMDAAGIHTMVALSRNDIRDSLEAMGLEEATDAQIDEALEEVSEQDWSSEAAVATDAVDEALTRIVARDAKGEAA